MGFVPSKYQQDIFNEIKNGKESLIIYALAGASKTTTIVKSLEYLPENLSILFLAFNKSIATELQERVPSHVQVRTLNALGHRAWLRHVGGKVQLNANKTWDILQNSPEYRAMLTQSEADLLEKVATRVRRMVALAKHQGIVPDGCQDAKGGILPDTMETWQELCSTYDVDLLDEEDQFDSVETKIKKENQMLEVCVGLARKCLLIGLEMWTEIDFDDQLYMTVAYRAKMDRHDIVMVDEAQDISSIQRKMLHGCVKLETGRLIGVGDKFQAIYQWRGASTNSMDLLKNEFNCKEFPLSITYRCPKSVVREAQQFVPHFEAAETAPEGEVLRLGEYDPRRMTEVFQRGDMVICRNNAPLVRCAFDLIRAGMAAKIMGRDIGSSLTGLVKKLRPKNFNDLAEKLAAWKDKEIAKALKKDPDANLSSIEERYECLLVFMEKSQSGTIPGLNYEIEAMFDESKNPNQVTLCSVHKSKGLERDRVIFLNSHLIPSKYARKPEAIAAEWNIFYVGVTRAKKSLVYVNSPKKK